MTSMSTFLQIDLQNLFFEAKNKGEKIDLEKILIYFNSRETEYLTEAIVYMVRNDDFNSGKFETKLVELGYNLKTRDALKITRDNRTFYRQTNHDVGLTVDCIAKLDMFDKWILMSGDGDFADLCKFIKQKKKKVEVWSFRECYNSALEPYVDRVHFIDDKFFYKRPNVKVFGPSHFDPTKKHEKH